MQMLPILPLKAVCLPGEVLKVELTEERYRKLVERCLNHAGELAVVFCSDYNDELGTMKSVGCQAKIVRHSVCSSGLLSIDVQGVSRFSFQKTEEKLGVFYASEIQLLEDIKDVAGTDQLFLEVTESYQAYLNDVEKLDVDLLPELKLQCVGYNDLFKVINDISMSWEKKQQGMEINSIKKRLKFILSCLQFERDMLMFVNERCASEDVVSELRLSALN